MIRHLNDFISGLTFWVRGWKLLLSKRALWVAALIPVVISGVATALLIGLLISRLPDWLHNLMGHWLGETTGLWREMIYYPLLVSTGLLLMVMSVYLVFILQSVVAIPFYSFLAARTVSELGRRPRSGGRGGWRLFWTTASKGALLLFLGLVLFLLSFLPILNIFAFAGVLLLMAFNCLDYAFDVWDLSLRGRALYVLQHWAQWLGMGAALALTLLLPGLTLLVIPGAVVGAALIVDLD